MFSRCAIISLCALMLNLSEAVRAEPPAPPSPKSTIDTREPIILTLEEREHMLEGMRLYLQSLQGIVESLAKNQLDGASQYAHEAGAKMLQGVPLSIPLKAPIAFTALSLSTHEKFDTLADRARAASRGEVLNALAEIMSNCTDCHAAYRVVPSP